MGANKPACPHWLNRACVMAPKDVFLLEPAWRQHAGSSSIPAAASSTPTITRLTPTNQPDSCSPDQGSRHNNCSCHKRAVKPFSPLRSGEISACPTSYTHTQLCARGIRAFMGGGGVDVRGHLFFCSFLHQSSIVSWPIFLSLPLHKRRRFTLLKAIFSAPRAADVALSSFSGLAVR